MARPRWRRRSPTSIGEFEDESCVEWPARVGQVCVVRKGPRMRTDHVLGRAVRECHVVLEVSANGFQGSVTVGQAS